jgi:hypothetical protein
LCGVDLIVMGESENKSSKFDTLAWLAVITSIGFIAWFVFSNFIPARAPSLRLDCINNLRQLDAAKREWALENGKTNGVVCTENDIKPYIKLDSKGNIPRCPAGGIYTIGKVGEAPTCSITDHVLP